jgi:hypothetical protein
MVICPHPAVPQRKPDIREGFRMEREPGFRPVILCRIKRSGKQPAAAMECQNPSLCI